MIIVDVERGSQKVIKQFSPMAMLWRGAVFEAVLSSFEKSENWTRKLV